MRSPSKLRPAALLLALYLSPSPEGWRIEGSALYHINDNGGSARRGWLGNPWGTLTLDSTTAQLNSPIRCRFELRGRHTSNAGVGEAFVIDRTIAANGAFELAVREPGPNPR